MFLKNVWYVAASSDEVGSAPLARTILEERVVLYRLSNGDPVALADRCPHRFLPLSKGKVIGDNLRCGYHGLAFGRDGICVSIPTQDQIPTHARVKSYPVREAYGFLWIWPGVPELASEGRFPEFPAQPGLEHHLSAEWGSARGYYNPQASYMLVIDNLLDLSHVTLVHSSSLAAGGYDKAEITVEVGERGVSDRRVARGIAAGPAFGSIFGNPDTLIDYWLEIHWSAPSTLLLDSALPRSGQAKRSGARFLASQLVTPETRSSCHYWWVSSRNYEVADEKLTETWRQIVEFAFTEDAAILSAQQREVGEADIMDLRPVVLQTDRSDVQARRILKRLLTDEQATQQATSR